MADRTLRRWRTLLLAVALSGAATGTRAVTYIVDNKNPRAADSNPGTRSLPLLTISGAAKRVRPGDTVLARPGVYHEAVTLTVSGTPAQPITFQSEAPGAAVVDGADIVRDLKAEGAGVWSFSAPGIQTNNYGDFAEYGEWVYVNGSPLPKVAERVQLVPGAFFMDYKAQRIYVAPDEGQDIGAVKVEYAHRQGLFSPPPAPRPDNSNAVALLNDIHILGFTVQHCADWFQGRKAIKISGQRWLVENNHVLWASYGGISASASNHCIIRGNRVEWCGDEGIAGDGNADLHVENNKIYHCDWRRINPDFGGGAGKLVLTIDSRIEGNECAYNYGYGPWFDIHNTGNVLQNNVSHDNMGGAGLMSEISSDNTFLDNICYNNRDIGILIAESPGCVAQRNICFNNVIGMMLRGNYTRPNDHGRTGGVSVEGYYSPGMEGFRKSIEAIPGITTTQVQNYLAKYLLYWAAPAQYMSNNSLIWDNLLFDNATNLFEERDYRQPSPVAPFVNNFSDHNLFWSADPRMSISPKYGAPGYDDLAAWQKASGRDTSSVFADPRAKATRIPAWAEAKRAIWSQRFRSWPQFDALNPELTRSPSASEAMARLLRGGDVQPFKLRDPAIKAFVFTYERQRLLALWTNKLDMRRTVRLNLHQNAVVYENPYCVQSPRRLTNQTLTLPLTHLPIYLRGIGDTITEAAE